MSPPCAACGELPDSIEANTGRDESLPAPVSRLKRLWPDSGRGDLDALLCPTCGAWFVWRDHSSWTGSGNNDSESLERVPPQTWWLFERLLHGEVSERPEELVAAVFGGGKWKDLFLRAIQSWGPEQRDQLMPALVERLTAYASNDENLELYGLLSSAAKPSSAQGRPRCERLAALLRERALHAPLTGRAKFLLELCERSLGARQPAS